MQVLSQGKGVQRGAETPRPIHLPLNPPIATDLQPGARRASARIHCMHLRAGEELFFLEFVWLLF